MMGALLWTRLVFLLVLGAIVGFYAWTAYRTNEDGER
jgi:hypothetical protein